MAKTGKVVRGNAGLALDLQRKLEAAVSRMHADIVYRLAVSGSSLAQDAAPVSWGQILADLADKWLQRFEKLGEKLAGISVTKMAKAADRATIDSLIDAGFAVEFRPSATIKAAMQAAISEQVAKIRSIPERYFARVEKQVTESAMAGRDLKKLTDSLQDSYQISRRSARFIAQNQNNAVTSAIFQARCTESGVVEAEWRHSHGGRHPRPSHLAADRKRYKIAEGMLIDGEYIRPGQKPNCRCHSAPVIPGFSRGAF